jgi:GTP cyclohydrolase III
MENNIEQFLIANKFELYSFYKTNKVYYRKINDLQMLHVRIYSDVNKIIDVEYMHTGISKFDKRTSVTLETVETTERLKSLLNAIF